MTAMLSEEHERWLEARGFDLEMVSKFGLYTDRQSPGGRDLVIPYHRNLTTPEGASLSQGRGRRCGRAEMTDSQQARADAGSYRQQLISPITVSGEILALWSLSQKVDF
jgi:hypothetical protein